MQGFVQRLARGAAAAELPLVLMAAPALLFPTPRRMLVLVVILLTWLGARLAGGAWVPRTPLNGAVWLLLASVGLSAWVTPDLRFSLGKIAGVLLGVVLFWAAVRWTTTERRFWIAAAAFLLAGAALAVIGLLGTNWLGKFPLLDGITSRLPAAIRGVPGAEDGFNPNAVAGCLVLFVPLQVALVVSGGWRRFLPEGVSLAAGRSLCAALLGSLGLTAGTLLLTQSRGALASVFVALMGLAVCHGRRGRRVAVVGCLVASIALAAIGPANLARHTLNQEGSGIVGTLESRLELWSRALMAIRDFPFTGVGMNGFRRVVPVLYPTLVIPPGTDVVHAHNHLLQAALDLGVLGLAAYLAIWLLVGTLLVHVHRRSGNTAHRTLALGLGGGLVAHFLFGITDVIPLGAKVGVLFWLTLALAVALHQVSGAAHKPSSSAALVSRPTRSRARLQDT